jgi:putative tricarboxylic transport membrane protein
MRKMKTTTAALAAAALLSSAVAPALAWEPTKPIEIVVPAAGGGADQLAREIAKVIEKDKLSSQKVVVTNMGAGSGAQAYLFVKGKKGDDHTLVVTLSSLFTLPVARGAAFKWDDLTPVARLALDEFVLWVNAATPYKTAEEYLKAAAENPGKFRMGGTGAAQEDQIVTILLEQAAKAKFTYVPLAGGSEVAAKLVEKFVDSTVNNPSEAVKAWKDGKVRPLGLFNSIRMAYAGEDWKAIPTMKEQGVDVEYVMMRGIFGPPDMPAPAKEYYTELLHKVSASPEFKAYLKTNALKDAWLTGDNFKTWLSQQDDLHRRILVSTGLKGS